MVMDVARHVSLTGFCIDKLLITVAEEVEVAEVAEVEAAEGADGKSER